MQPVYGKPGSISWGSLALDDLIPSFIDALDEIRERLAAPGSTQEPPAETMERSKTVGEIDDLLGAIEQRMEADDYFESEEADYDLEALTEQLEGYAAPFFYFGASEGDGTDFGFWPDLQTFEDACQAGEVIKLPAGDPWPADELAERPDVIGVAYVTDHGNVSLWAAGPEQPKKPIWDLV